MKKLFFTAIATIAFSGASMANSSDLAINNEELGPRGDCVNASLDFYEHVMDDFNGGGDDLSFLNALVDMCNRYEE
jgi:hypothetical protein